MQPVPPHIAAITRPVDRLMTYYTLTAMATLFGFPITILVLYFRYHTMRYEFGAEGLRMSWGILFRHEVLLNYARIQDIHLRSNAIERLLGLARIEIQTASGAGSSVMTLEGLTDHERMRDFLYSRMRGAADAKHGAAPDAGLTAVLHEVAAELRAVRAALEKR
ncbi:MAG: PH domain-containing protein [Acidobacteria bacterium]|nr:PH domain-containing protein [Acidobacteriota bacterium]